MEERLYEGKKTRKPVWRICIYVSAFLVFFCSGCGFSDSKTKEELISAIDSYNTKMVRQKEIVTTSGEETSDKQKIVTDEAKQLYAHSWEIKGEDSNKTEMILQVTKGGGTSYVLYKTQANWNAEDISREPVQKNMQKLYDTKCHISKDDIISIKTSRVTDSIQKYKLKVKDPIAQKYVEELMKDSEFYKFVDEQKELQKAIRHTKENKKQIMICVGVDIEKTIKAEENTTDMKFVTQYALMATLGKRAEKNTQRCNRCDN